MVTVEVYGRTPRILQIDRQATEDKPKIFGLAFPTGDNSTNTYFQKQAGLALVKNNLQQLLQTEPGERVMLPNYGASLNRFVFEPMDKETFEEITTTIANSIRNYAPGARVLKIQATPDTRTGLEELGILKLKVILQLRELERQIIELELTV